MGWCRFLDLVPYEQENHWLILLRAICIRHLRVLPVLSGLCHIIRWPSIKNPVITVLMRLHPFWLLFQGYHAGCLLGCFVWHAPYQFSFKLGINMAASVLNSYEEQIDPTRLNLTKISSNFLFKQTSWTNSTKHAIEDNLTQTWCQKKVRFTSIC